MAVTVDNGRITARISRIGMNVRRNPNARAAVTIVTARVRLSRRRRPVAPIMDPLVKLDNRSATVLQAAVDGVGGAAAAAAAVRKVVRRRNGRISVRVAVLRI
jgi:hypothetical protein